MRKAMFWALLTAALLLASAPAQAQTGTWMLTFTASTDHNRVEYNNPVVDHYELMVSPSDGTGGGFTKNLGKPTPSATNDITVNINTEVLALNPGDYVGRVKAVGVGGEAVSNPSSPFLLRVSAPSAPATAPTITKSSGL